MGRFLLSVNRNEAALYQPQKVLILHLQIRYETVIGEMPKQTHHPFSCEAQHRTRQRTGPMVVGRGTKPSPGSISFAACAFATKSWRTFMRHSCLWGVH
jgi:hypothetical protein